MVVFYRKMGALHCRPSCLGDNPLYYPSHDSFAFQRTLWRISIALVLSFAARSDADDVRTWTDATGTITKEGSFDHADEKWVHLKLVEGGTVRLPLAWLSQSDQDYIALQREPATQKSDSSNPRSATVAGKPSSLLSLTVEGLGVSKEDAEKDAYRNAIRQVVGAYVDAETIVANDEIIRDKVITLSSGYVEHAATKSLTQENGLFKVTVDAQVKITKLLDVLKQQNVSTVEIDPSAAQDAIAKAMTQEDQARSQEELLARAFRNYPEGCLKVSIDGKPTFTKNSILFRIKVEPDMEAFAAVADKVCEALAADGRRNGVLRNDSSHFTVGAADNNPLQFESFALKNIADRFQNIHQLVDVRPGHPSLSDNRTYNGILAIPPVLSMAMETPNGLRGPSTVFSYSEKEKEDHHIVFPFRASKSLKRIHWRWFAFSSEEREQFFVKHIHAAAMFSSLLGSDGAVVADDLIAINLGWSGTFGTKFLAPFCCELERDFYVPSFTFQRTIELAADELSQVRSVKCSVQAAEKGNNWP